MTGTEFLPVNREDMLARGWHYCDFLVIGGDAYVDHPSFGTAVISRVLEAEGYKVCVLCQPDWHSTDDFKQFGKPRYGAFIGAGNLDSMVAHYTAAKKRRSEDFYSPGKKAGLRPDRATIVYANRMREAYPDLPIVIGGLEASLRRFAHYDYWEDKVRRAIIFDAKADLLVYGMGEYATRQIAKRLSRKQPVSTITDVRGTSFIGSSADECSYPYIPCASFEKVCEDKRSYAEANMIQYNEHDAVRGKAIIQPHGDKLLITNPPAMPLTTEELDAVAELPYTREPHPMYDEMGGVAAIEEVRFSVIHNRGCIGACNFCSLAFHQGRMITSRSHESVIREVTEFTKHPLFKGYVHDIGGPTANFRHPSCQQQLKNGLCKGRVCLAPEPCKNIDADHSDYLALLRKLRQIPGIKKVFIRSGIRFDYMLLDKNNEFFAELVKYHISGQLKVAPEHCIDTVLDYMGKPHNEVYERFLQKYHSLNDRYDKKQFIVPYLMSSHPGSTLQDAVALAEYLNSKGTQPEQVQDFYPTPGTLSTCMYYTGIDPRTMKPVYVARDPHEKALQRALLQWKRPDRRRLVMEALQKAGREDLIGYGKHCLIRPNSSSKPKQSAAKVEEKPKGRAKGMSAKPMQKQDRPNGRTRGNGQGKQKTATKGKKR
ncbi:MAG: YgiQ family radical SAM protein [Ruminococcaceae bacterium]|nr:YgiQ family radical SAM protein [Oscillospiraceae bacterium]